MARLKRLECPFAFAARQLAGDANRSVDSVAGEVIDLVVDQADDGIHHETATGQQQRGKLESDGFARASGQKDDRIISTKRSLDRLPLSLAESVLPENVAEEPFHIFARRCNRERRGTRGYRGLDLRLEMGCPRSERLVLP